MSIININAFQNGINQDDFLTTYTDVYIKQAVANLGQRTGVEVNELQSLHNKVSDLLKVTINNYLRVKYSESNTIFYDKDLQLKSISNNTDIITTDDLKTLFYNSSFKLETGGVIKNDESDKFRLFKNYIDDYKVIFFAGFISNMYYDFFINIENNKPVIYGRNNSTGDYIKASKNTEITIDVLFDAIKGYRTVTEILNYFMLTINDFVIEGKSQELQRVFDIWDSYSEIINEYYNKKYYETDYYYRLISRICKRIFIDSKQIYSSDIYFHKDFVLNYVCRSSDKNIIYNSLGDICVNFVTEFDQNKINSNEILTVHISDTKKESINFIVSYDENNNVDKMVSNKICVYPYINTATEEWYVNDINTYIPSAGEDAGNPNIIFTYTSYLNGSFSTGILHSILDIGDLTEECNTYVDPVSIKRNNVNEVINENALYTLKNYLPDLSYITSSEEKLLSVNNALITSLIDIRQNKELYNQLYVDGDDRTQYITTFWHLSYTNSGYKYEYLKQPGKTTAAIDMGFLTNVKDLTAYILNNYYEPDKYPHTHLVFDKLNIKLKNSVSNDSNVYPVIKNYSGADLNESPEYNNPSNLVIKFANNVIFNNENAIESVELNKGNYVTFNDGNISKVVKCSYSNTYQFGSVFDSTTNSYLDIYPTLDLKEVFVNNINNENRIGVIGVGCNSDNSGSAYYGYFGVDPMSSGNNKNILKIGTSRKNYNIGNESLLNNNSTFKPFTELNIDMNTDVNGSLDVNGNERVSGSLSVSGSSNLHNTTINGELYVDGDAEITGNLKIGKNVEVNGIIWETHNNSRYTTLSGGLFTNYLSEGERIDIPKHNKYTTAPTISYVKLDVTALLNDLQLDNATITCHNKIVENNTTYMMLTTKLTTTVNPIVISYVVSAPITHRNVNINEVITANSDMDINSGNLN